MHLVKSGFGAPEQSFALFSCFTGLAYADVKGLTQEHVIKRKGKKWITKPRHKSKVDSVIPLLPQAEAILQRYVYHPEVAKGVALLPTPTNQKLNSYLKEVADLCGIAKNLTFHMARHTFATTVALLNDVSMESVSKMLGHTSIKTTQVYARVVHEKLLNDMEGV